MDIINNQDLAGANNAAELPILISSICDELIERLERVWRLPTNSALIRLSKDMLPHLRAIRRATKRKINQASDSQRKTLGLIHDLDVLTAEVAKWFRVEDDQLRGRDRKARVSMARHVAFSLARSITGAPFAAIGDYYDDRHHSSVIHGCKLIAAQMDKSPQFKCRMETLRDEIEAKLRT